MKKILALALLSLLFSTPAFAVPPTVLIIGDSISSGYTPIVDASLQGFMCVGHNKGNAGNTENLYIHLEEYLRDVQWTVIHVETGGLHNTSPAELVPPERYAELLHLTFTRLLQTGARIVWATTTERPQGAANVGLEVDYNAIASMVLRDFPEVLVDDLWSVSRTLLQDQHLSPGNVHYTQVGYEILAEYVEESLWRALGLSKWQGLVKKK